MWQLKVSDNPAESPVIYDKGIESKNELSAIATGESVGIP